MRVHHSLRTRVIPLLLAATLFATACGGGEDGFDDGTQADNTDAFAGQSDSNEFVETAPFDAVSATAQGPSTGPVGVRGQCAATAGAYIFDSSAEDNNGARIRLVVFAATNTVESASLTTGAGSPFTFTAIETVEVSPDRYFVSGQGSNGDVEVGPMNFTILCRA